MRKAKHELSEQKVVVEVAPDSALLPHTSVTLLLSAESSAICADVQSAASVTEIKARATTQNRRSEVRLW